MTPFLLPLLVDPRTGGKLVLEDAVCEGETIVAGRLVAEDGTAYPVVRGIPRFLPPGLAASVTSFGDEWNYFNFTDFKLQWLSHTVRNTFGSTEAFRDKVVVDAGGGSGAQSLWILESGAKHVIMLELSHSVDDVVQRNIDSRRWRNFDLIQCSIDAPPLARPSIDGIVMCHNVIQHTPSVERTARALFDLVKPGGEFVFNCYGKNDVGVLRWIRWHLVYLPLRAVLRRMPFRVIVAYARVMACLNLIPGLGLMLNKLLLCAQGDVPVISGEGFLGRCKRRFKACSLNTMDAFGSHAFQHHKTDGEIQVLVRDLQPDLGKVRNYDDYFRRPQPIGIALRVFR
jgi:SAM-dependent methyltransferase